MQSSILLSFRSKLTLKSEEFFINEMARCGKLASAKTLDRVVRPAI